MRAQRAPERLERDAAHAALAQAEAHIVQAREGGGDVPARAAPEDLRRRRSARPDNRVEVLRARLLCPEALLSAEHEVVLVGGQVREWVERVCVLPRLEGVAPRVAVGRSAMAVGVRDGVLTRSGCHRPSLRHHSPVRCSSEGKVCDIRERLVRGRSSQRGCE